MLILSRTSYRRIRVHNALTPKRSTDALSRSGGPTLPMPMVGRVVSARRDVLPVRLAFGMTPLTQKRRLRNSFRIPLQETPFSDLNFPYSDHTRRFCRGTHASRVSGLASRRLDFSAGRRKPHPGRVCSSEGGRSHAHSHAFALCSFHFHGTDQFAIFGGDLPGLHHGHLI